MGWALTQVGPEKPVASGTSVTPTLPGASTGAVGHPHLLVACLISANANAWTPAAGFTINPGSDISNSTISHATIAYSIDTTGGVTSATFTVPSNANLKAVLAEFDAGPGVTISLNAVGEAIAGAVNNCNVVSGTAATIGDLIVCCFNQFLGTIPPVPTPEQTTDPQGFSYHVQRNTALRNPSGGAAPIVTSQSMRPSTGQFQMVTNLSPGQIITWHDPSGFTLLGSDTATAGRHLYSGYQLSAPSSGTVSVTGSTDTVSINPNSWTGVLATFTATAPPGLKDDVGAAIRPGTFNPSGLTLQQCISQWQVYVGRPLTVRAQDFTSGIPAAITADLQSDATAGRKVCMSFSPAFNPTTTSDLNALNTFLNSCKNGGLEAEVALYIDPPNVAGMTASLCIAAYQFYASTIRQYYPLVFVLSAFAAETQAGATFYPGDAFVDKISTILYGSQYFGSGTRLDTVAALADGASPPKPLGLWNFNASTVGASGTAFMGATVNENIFPAGTTATQALQQFASNTHRPVTVGKIFNTPPGTAPPGTPSPFPTKPTAHMQGWINNGTYAVLLYWPSYIANSTAPPFGFVANEKTLLTNSITSLQAAGLKVRSIVLAQEPQNSQAQLSPACYVAMQQFFYSTVNALGLPLIYDAASHVGFNHPELWSAYYPGDAFTDGCAIDTYGNMYTSGLRYDQFIAIADNASPPKPFGFYELGISIPLTPFQTQAQIQTFLGAVQTIMVNRLNAGKPNLDCMWYNGAAGAEGINQNTLAPNSGTSPSRQFVCDTIYPALVDALTGGGGGLTSAQISQFFGYVQTFYSNRIAASKSNGPIMIQNGTAAVVAPAIITGDTRIPLFVSIFDALDDGSGVANLSGEEDITVGITGQVVSSQGMSGEMDLTFNDAGTMTASPPPLPPPGPVSFPTYAPPVYTFFTTDLVTGAVLGEIPVTGVSLDCQLNSAGNMQATGNLDDSKIPNADFIARTTPGRTAFWAYRQSPSGNFVIVWGGIIWTRSWVSKGKVFSFTGQTFESYAARRFPRSVLGTAVQQYNPDGQCFIINDLWRLMQSVTSGDIGVRASGLPGASDIQRQLTVNGWDLSTSFDDLIQSILVFSDGPDYSIAWHQDSNGLPIKQLVVAPRIGKQVGTTNLIVDYPGTIEDYSYVENASSGSNQWWAVGDGVDAAAIVGEATDQASLSAGWPLIEGVNSYSGVTEQSTIDSHAASDLKSLPMPLVNHSADLFGASKPEFGTYNMGDYVVANVTDPRFGSGVQFSVRVIGWSIQPPDNQSGVETITLVFDEPTGSGS